MSNPLADLLHHLRRLAAPSRADSDAELLERFARLGDEDAFAVLMARYGAMVLNTCRRVLGDAHAAEDAFQAAFLVLARRARSLRQPQALAGWLHGVACRTAREARRRQARQPHVRLGDTSEPADDHHDPLAALTARDLLAVLEEEVQRLPRNYRLAVVLCCLEGLSQEEAARRLGWTAGAIKGRLERGRKRLRQKLEKRGVVLSAALGTVEMMRGAVTANTAALLPRAALAFASGQVTRGAEVATLAERVIRAMIATRVKIACALVLTAAVLSGGAGMVTHGLLTARQAEAARKREAEPPPRVARKAAPLPAVSGFLATPIRFRGDASQKVSDAVLDLLASCHHAHAQGEGPMPDWDDVLLDCINKKIYLHVQLPKPRNIKTAMEKDDKVQVSEMILELRPGGLWVRSGDKAKWYAKYEHDKMVRLQGLLKYADADNSRREAKGAQAEKKPGDPAAVSGLLGGRTLTFARGLSTEMEGLVISLLGSSSVGRMAAKKEWEAALKEEHLRVQYPKPRVLTASVQEDSTFEADEIVMEGVMEKTTRYIFVRTGNKFRAFAKFDAHIWLLLKDRFLAYLKSPRE